MALLLPMVAVLLSCFHCSLSITLLAIELRLAMLCWHCNVVWLVSQALANGANAEGVPFGGLSLYKVAKGTSGNGSMSNGSGAYAAQLASFLVGLKGPALEAAEKLLLGVKTPG